MGFTLNSGALFSRGIRNQVGDRGGGGNFIDKLFQAGKEIVNVVTGGNLKGFLIGAALAQIPSLIFSLSNLWSIFTTSAIELYYFDWNIPDDRLDQQAKARWQIYGSLLGGTAGSAIGFFACGIVPASSLMVFNEDLATYVLREVGEEAFEELTFQFAYALRLSVRNLGRQALGWLYKGARSWLKDPENPLGRLIFGPRFEEVRETWGAADAPSWSFAQAVEDRIEKIPSTFWQNFTEELIEEAIDACIEAGYVVSSSVESFYARQRMAQSFSREPQRVVEVKPDRSNDAEVIVLAGPESQVRGHLPAVIATHQILADRDLGQLIGQPVDDYIRPRPFDGLRLQFKLYSLKTPPYARRGVQRLVEVTVSVSDVSRAALDWDKLRFACGGQNGYIWGRFRAHAILSNGHPLTVYGGTPDEAEDRLRAFLQLSTTEIKTISITEEKKEAQRLINPKLYKETTRVYPAYVSIINRERTLSFDLGKRSRDGNYVDKRARFDLWRATKPPDFEDKLIELLRRLGPGEIGAP
jgi:mannitol/fructose-specific phosphotransferase system IIA component